MEIDPIIPVKMLLQDLTRKGPFFLHPCKILQDPVGSCGILEESCRNSVQDSCKILQDPQDPARYCRDARKKDLFL